MWYRTNLLQVTVMLINANQEVRVFAWCYVTRYLTYGVLTTLVFSPVVHTRRKYCFLAKNFFSLSGMIATTVCGQRAYAEARHTSCLTEVDAQKSCGWKLRVFITVQKKTNCLISTLWTLYFLTSRMIANTPRFSRHDVRYRRVNLKT
jgi:hypothetical protein